MLTTKQALTLIKSSVNNQIKGFNEAKRKGDPGDWYLFGCISGKVDIFNQIKDPYDIYNYSLGQNTDAKSGIMTIYIVKEWSGYNEFMRMEHFREEVYEL